MHMDKDKWVAGWTISAPDMRTCHMSATQKQETTHDVGERISWNLRPAVSKRRKTAWQSAKNGRCLPGVPREEVRKRILYQFDGLVNLYDEKFAKPAKEIVEILKKNKSLEHKTRFTNEVEWIYWELCTRREARTPRRQHDGPDYTWWHGMYEVGKNFYMKFIPRAKLKDKEANAHIDKMLAGDWHKWFRNASEKETLER